MKFAVTIFAILLGLAVILGVMSNAQKTNAPQDTNNVAADGNSADATPDTIEPADEQVEVVEVESTQDDSPATEATIDSNSVPTGPALSAAVPQDEEAIPGLHAVTVTDGRDTVIGFEDPKSVFKLRVEISQYGAAISRITLSDYLKTVGKPDHYIVHDKLALPDLIDPTDRSKDRTLWFAYAAKTITVNGTSLALETNDVWSAGDVSSNELASSVTYTATIADGDDQPVLKIIRRYTLKADSYDLSLDQQLVNLTQEPMTVRWAQNFQGDLVNDSGYLGDRRQFVAGHFALWYDTQREKIYTKDAEMLRSKLVGSKTPSLWPIRGLNPQAELAWLASLNRYFAVVTHVAVDESVTVTADIPPLEAMFPHIDQSVEWDRRVMEPTDAQKVMVLKAATDTLKLEASGQIDLDLGIFAGPRKPELFATAPYSTLHLDETIVYSLGGMCSFCTFQWLAHGLLWLLKLFEGQILVLGGIGIGVHDWGLSIILLVLVVRLILHPVTKRAQINMMKMGKMMQAIAPDVEKIKKKYKDDQQKINAEMMKLYREKGVNPANILGCLPMLMQTPIWIALYAMLYFAIELRHEPAFWGFFQWVSGGSWGFLSDLSSQDGFIPIFDEPVMVNVLITTVKFQSVNILPLLMGIVFYFQQKLTTPPPANEQAAQQQKMMKFMIFLFPVFLFFAPSGLTLYILASTSAGIIDSTIVRRHIKQQEESGELFKPNPVKAGGFRDRISKAVEAKQQQLAAQQQQQQNKGGKSRKKR
jgi:YidC/Oxa1 family membrane protein insertase